MFCITNGPTHAMKLIKSPFLETHLAVTWDCLRLLGGELSLLGISWLFCVPASLYVDQMDGYDAILFGCDFKKVGFM